MRMEPSPVTLPEIVRLAEPVKDPAVMVRLPRTVRFPSGVQPPEALLNVRLFKLEVPEDMSLLVVPAFIRTVPELWVKVPLLMKFPVTVSVPEEEVSVPAAMVRSDSTV